MHVWMEDITLQIYDDVNLNNISRFSSCLTENTLHLCYKDELGDALKVKIQFFKNCMMSVNTPCWPDVEPFNVTAGDTYSYVWVRLRSFLCALYAVLHYWLTIGPQMAVRLSALHTGRPLLPGRFLVLIYVRGWIDLRTIVRLEGLGQLKNPVTSSGMEPACNIASQRNTLPRPQTLRNSK
jgi:hypothetical protein